MGARTDFWLYVHELSLCLDNEGDSREERRANILGSLADMPRMAREEVAREMGYLVDELRAINVEVKNEQRIEAVLNRGIGAG